MPDYRRLPLLVFLALASASCLAPKPPRTNTAGAPATAATAPTTWLDQFARGYFPGRSGQVFLVSREGDFVVDRDPLYAFMHGSPWEYDTHIPLLFHGAPFIKPGVVEGGCVAAGRRPHPCRPAWNGPAGDGDRADAAAGDRIDDDETSRDRDVRSRRARADYFDTMRA